MKTKLRRLRGRFGITAPRVAIKPHVPWHWRLGASALVLGIALGLAGWIYDAGRSFAGFDRSRSEEQLDALRAELTHLQEENQQLRKVANSSESVLQIGQTAQQSMEQQIRRLESENGQLKEELAVLESVGKCGSSSANVAPGLSHLSVEADATPGNYRYRVLMTAGNGQGDKDVNGSVQFAVTGMQKDKTVILVVPGAARVSFRRLLRHSGNFQIPADVKIKDIEARLLVGGAVAATTKISL